jgi:hypothetical protein
MAPSALVLWSAPRLSAERQPVESKILWRKTGLLAILPKIFGPISTSS